MVGAAMTTNSEPAYGVMSGTVGDDVMTVHELVWVAGEQRPKCGDGAPKDRVEEWFRRVNCPYCLNDEQAPTA
ncbi:hypothetical protein DC74_140 [Streptomyces noursei]|nr:hypothetical protein DC74_140 [Streptomyces noursei]